MSETARKRLTEFATGERGPYTNLVADVQAVIDENIRMRAALEETRINLELVERPRFKDPDYGAEVEALGERIGYGALMSSAQASWRATLKRRGDPLGSEFVAGPCFATMLKNLAMVRAALNPDSTSQA